MQLATSRLNGTNATRHDVRLPGRQDRNTRWLASVAFGGAPLFATGGALAAGSFFALSDKPDVLTAATAQSINLIQGDVGTAMSSRIRDGGRCCS